MLLVYSLSCLIAGPYALETIPSFLLYEDRRAVDIQNGHQVNFLTLKENVHKEVKRMKEFTLCWRMNLLSYGDTEGDKATSGPIWLQSDNYVNGHRIYYLGKKTKLC